MNGVATMDFQWPMPIPLRKLLIDVLDVNVEERYFLPDKYVDSFVPSKSDKTTNGGILVAGRCTAISGHDILKRVYSPIGCSPTLTTCGGGNAEPKVIVMGVRQ